MGAILTGIAIAVVIAVGSGIFMFSQQEPSWQVYSTTSTRVGDPGSNLVGPGWTGEAAPGETAT